MTTYAIIGNGIAGLSAAQEIRRNDAEGRIFLFSSEPHYTYARISLKHYLKGQTKLSELFVHSPQWYADNHIQVVGQAVSKLHIETKEVAFGGRKIRYDKLIFAMGAVPHDLEVPGRSLTNISTFYGLADANIAQTIGGNDERVLVIGGGVLAAETADCLAHRGAKVSMLIRGKSFNDKFVDTMVNQLLIERLLGAGVQIIFEDEVEQFEDDGSGNVARAKTRKGRTIPCDHVRICIGTRSRLSLLAGTPLASDAGIGVDEHLQTNLPDVFAAGDIVSTSQSGNWTNAADMGLVAGHNASCAGRISYAPSTQLRTTYLQSLTYCWIGDHIPMKNDGDILVRKWLSQDGQRYEKFVLQNGRLIGVCLWDGRPIGITLQRLMKSKVDLTRHVESLTSQQFEWRNLTVAEEQSHQSICSLRSDNMPA